MSISPSRILSILSPENRADGLLSNLLSAIELTDDTVFITERDGTIIYVNPAFEKTTGFPRTEAEGRTPRILKSGLQDLDHYKELWSTILRGDVFRRMIINRRKNGEIYYADQTITPTRDQNGEISHFITVVKDMTEYRRLQEQEMEMRIAAQVQKRLYPREAPKRPGLDIAGAVFPSTAICGDYYDYLEMPNATLGIAVGDVSGHGIGPALIMAQTRAYLRSFVKTEHRTGLVLEKLNTVLFDDLERHRFMTMILACIDPLSRRMIYASAGHDSGYVLDRHGDLKNELVSTGLPLGVLENSCYQKREWIDLASGDIVFFCTDGLTESQAHHNDFLEIPECLEVIRGNRDLGAAAIIDKLHEKVVSFSRGLPQNDDITLVMVKVK